MSFSLFSVIFCSLLGKTSELAKFVVNYACVFYTGGWSHLFFPPEKWVMWQPWWIWLYSALWDIISKNLQSVDFYEKISQNILA